MLGDYLNVNCTIRQMIYETSQPRLEWFIHNQKATQLSRSKILNSKPVKTNDALSVIINVNHII
ncbi:unnamed protein product, partial [Oppiella nova]